MHLHRTYGVIVERAAEREPESASAASANQREASAPRRTEVHNPAIDRQVISRIQGAALRTNRNVARQLSPAQRRTVTRRRDRPEWSYDGNFIDVRISLERGAGVRSGNYGDARARGRRARNCARQRVASSQVAKRPSLQSTSTPVGSRRRRRGLDAGAAGEEASSG